MVGNVGNDTYVTDAEFIRLCNNASSRCQLAAMQYD